MDAEATLSCLYDGRTIGAGTQKRGREYVPNPFLTVFLASTNNLPSKFKEESFWQGFYNRFIFVPAVRKRRLTLNSRLAPEQKERARELLRFLNRLKIMNGMFYLVLDDKAQVAYSEFESKIEDTIERNDLGFKEGYYGGIPNFVTRIASLLRINRMSMRELEDVDNRTFTEPFLQVCENDMKLAIKLGDIIWEWFEEMLRLRVKYSGKPADVSTTERYEAVLLNLFKSAGKRELPQNYLRTRSKIKTKDMVDALEGFAHWENGKETGGRRPRLWVLNDDIEL